jgi:hypothetical protein
MTCQVATALKETGVVVLEYASKGRVVSTGFGGTIVDGVDLPVWSALLESSARY